MTTWSGPDPDHQPATYESQPVVERNSRTPAYDRDPESDTGCFADIQHDRLGMPRTYVTEISVPYFGDDEVQRLRAPMKNPNRAQGRVKRPTTPQH
jgi:hypothetical protein